MSDEPMGAIMPDGSVVGQWDERLRAAGAVPIYRSQHKTGVITIVVQGGLVQAVVSDDPKIVGMEFQVVDYDTEGSPESDLSDVLQPDESISQAFVWGDQVAASRIKVFGPPEEGDR